MTSEGGLPTETDVRLERRSRDSGGDDEPPRKAPGCGLLAVALTGLGLLVATWLDGR